MNKSLEILEYFRAEQMTYDNTPFLLHDFDEAIAELEAMEERIKELETPKSCDGCKQSWKPNNQTFHKYFCEYLKIPIHGDFYCNRYEAKVELWQEVKLKN